MMGEGRERPLTVLTDLPLAAAQAVCCALRDGRDSQNILDNAEGDHSGILALMAAMDREQGDRRWQCFAHDVTVRSRASDDEFHVVFPARVKTPCASDMGARPPSTPSKTARTSSHRAPASCSTPMNSHLQEACALLGLVVGEAVEGGASSPTKDREPSLASPDMSGPRRHVGAARSDSVLCSPARTPKALPASMRERKSPMGTGQQSRTASMPRIARGIGRASKRLLADTL